MASIYVVVQGKSIETRTEGTNEETGEPEVLVTGNVRKVASNYKHLNLLVGFTLNWVKQFLRENIIRNIAIVCIREFSSTVALTSSQGQFYTEGIVDVHSAEGSSHGSHTNAQSDVHPSVHAMEEFPLSPFSVGSPRHYRAHMHSSTISFRHEVFSDYVRQRFQSLWWIVGATEASYGVCSHKLSMTKSREGKRETFINEFGLFGKSLGYYEGWEEKRGMDGLHLEEYDPRLLGTGGLLHFRIEASASRARQMLSAIQYIGVFQAQPVLLTGSTLSNKENSRRMESDRVVDQSQENNAQRPRDRSESALSSALSALSTRSNTPTPMANTETRKAEAPLAKPPVVLRDPYSDPKIRRLAHAFIEN